MANTSATKKDIRKSARRAAINQNKRSGIRTFLKKVETAIASGDKDGAKEALRVAQSEMMSGVTKNLYKLNTASRKISRLAARVKAIN
ncbi:MAG: rpsT [Rickettsiaceae bacterium]|jgi:small subunit ribosomal protein S20|nr:rpsT [Rickettsiaceae bacterium]